MEVIFVILPLAIVMAGMFLWMFFRAAKSGQFDDLDTPSYRAIFDDEVIKPVIKPTPEVK